MDSQKTKGHSVWQNIIVGIIVTVIGGIILAYINIIQDARSDPSKRDKSTCPNSATIVDESLVNVPANEYWHDTGIKVQKGDCLEFVATGSWWNGISTTGPDGDSGFLGIARPACGGCPVTDGNLGELIGKVDDGYPFRIGSFATKEINQDGNLILAMNENTGPCKDEREGSCYDDNNGVLEVKVTVRRIK